MKETVQSLRKAGNKVRVIHSRYLIGTKKLHTLREIRETNAQSMINAKGGQTLVEITTPQGKDFAATVKCYALTCFNHKTALEEALARIDIAMKS